MALLLSIAYLPPISYFALIAKGLVLSADKVEPSVVYIEACENYQKQSWRNRCRFYASEKVDYKTGWLIRTERAIVSAYKTSAYFDYYKDELFSILDAHPETLFELDMDILRFFLAKTGIAAEIRLTNEYVPVASCAEALPTKYGLDYREILHPKRPDNVLDELGLKKPYFQVFAQKYGFVSNLSIMDLLFNEGPDSILYLKNI